MKQTKCERDNWFDVIKFIASFFVICIHIPLVGGKFAIAVNAFARFAVPTFFAISGFYAYQADAKAVKRRLIKTFRLYLISSAIYHTRSIVSYIAEQGVTGLVNYALDVFCNVENVMSFLFFNTPFTSVHLWYLLALMYVYLIWLVILKYSLDDKIIFLIGAFTILANLVLGELLSAFGIVLDVICVRNFAFTGLPFFIFGYLLRKYNHLLTKIKPIYLIIAIVVGSFEQVLSRFLFGHNEVFIGSVLCCFSIILLVKKIKPIDLSDKAIVIFRSSGDIYVFHLLFSGILDALANILPSALKTVIVFLLPCWAFGLCIVFSLLKTKIIRYLSVSKAQKNTV